MKNPEKNLSQQNRKFVKEMAYGKPKIIMIAFEGNKRETNTQTQNKNEKEIKNKWNGQSQSSSKEKPKYRYYDRSRDAHRHTINRIDRAYAGEMLMCLWSMYHSKMIAMPNANNLRSFHFDELHRLDFNSQHNLSVLRRFFFSFFIKTVSVFLWKWT